jgi:HD-like signal output (HDOD) protein
MFEEATLEKRQRTELVLKNVYNLPPMPKVIDETLKLLNSDSSTIQQLSSVIAKDQSLVTKILSIANSPLYGLQRRVTTIDFAITILGYSELRNIVLILSMIESFKNKTDKYLNQKEFWLHSYLVGSAAKRVTEDLGLQHSSEAFISGFLHDLGVTVIHRYFHSNFVAIHQLVENEGMNHYDAEIEVLGISHGEIGTLLLDKWNFPQSLCEPVKYHHRPNQAQNNSSLAAVIYLIDYMTQKFEIGAFQWDEKVDIDMDMIECLNFKSEEELNEFIDSYKEVFAEQIENIRLFN